jgi:hypothetical protein
MRHDVVDVGLRAATIDDAAGQHRQRFDPAGGLLGQRGAGLSWLASRMAWLTAVRIEIMAPVILSNSVRIWGFAES